MAHKFVTEGPTPFSLYGKNPLPAEFALEWLLPVSSSEGKSSHHRFKGNLMARWNHLSRDGW